MTDTPKKCPSAAEIETLLARNKNGKPVAVDADLARHLESCSICRAEAESIRRDNALLALIKKARISRVVTDRASTSPTVADSDAIEGYEILSEIHRGGQGVVYRAIQLVTKRTVALKVLLLGAFASTRQRHRFEREIDLAASLQHPNIVRVYDSGVTSDGRHYFTMEYLEGSSLDECLHDFRSSKKTQGRETRSEIRDATKRLHLLLKICEAVSYAHQHGVIHRDLKPANILVDLEGHPHILDFGLAKAVDATLAEGSIQTTRSGEFMGTLAYASPEQVKCDPSLVDIRSDVYSLGVIGYELLSGRFPYTLQDKNIFESARVIREEKPTPLSSADKFFRGDLDTIVAKALEKEPDRRYSSVAELAADIRRYLQDEPIAARSASATYQLKMFARRNRALVSAIMGIVLSLVAGLTSAVWQANRAAQARNELAALAESLEKMFAETEPHGQNLSVKKMLDQVSTELLKTDVESRSDARLRHILGSTYVNFASYEVAEPHLRKALDYRRLDLGLEHRDTLRSMHRLAVSLDFQSKHSEAEAYYREALAVQHRLFGVMDKDTLTTGAGLANLLLDTDELEEAGRLVSEGLNACGQAFQKENEITLYWKNAHGRLLQSRGELLKAEEVFRETLESRRMLSGERHPGTLSSMSNLADVLCLRGSKKRPNSIGRRKFEEAERLYLKALKGNQEILGHNSPETREVLDGLIKLYDSWGKPKKADEYRAMFSFKAA
ncbi:MAG: serine/threonine-protein kinase [Phycisphaerales bacterium]|nr:serine/threonine-protein kinase [Phycisphaerales bacterium]